MAARFSLKSRPRDSGRNNRPGMDPREGSAAQSRLNRTLIQASEPPATSQKSCLRVKWKFGKAQALSGHDPHSQTSGFKGKRDVVHAYSRISCPAHDPSWLNDFSRTWIQRFRLDCLCSRWAQKVPPFLQRKQRTSYRPSRRKRWTRLAEETGFAQVFSTDGSMAGKLKGPAD